MNGPRSLMRTMTLFPLCLLVTFTFVPKAIERCAAVNLEGFMRSPEAVLEFSAYQDAPPQPADAEKAWTGANKTKVAEIAVIAVFEMSVLIVKTFHHVLFSGLAKARTALEW